MLRKILLGFVLVLVTAIAVLAVVNLTHASEPIPELVVAHGESKGGSPLVPLGHYFG